MHHIVSDGWSMGVLMREAVELYGAFAAGRPSPLPPLPVQYADFAAWQREWLRGEVREALVGHWRRRLGGGLAELALPFDRPRSAQPDSRGAVVGSRLPAGPTRALGELGHRTGATSSSWCCNNVPQGAPPSLHRAGGHRRRNDGRRQSQ